MGSAGFQPFQLEEARARLRKMTDEELIRFGRASAGMCSPEANFGEYRTGQLLKVEYASVAIYPGDRGNDEKARYELTIQDGPDQYMAVYRMNYFQHDRSKDLVAGKDVEYRIAGGNLFVKLPDGKEIKAGLCRRTPEGLLICP